MNIDGNIRFTESHVRPLRKAQKLVLRCLVTAQPNSYTWKQKLRAEISSKIDLLLHAMSKSLVWNQIIQIPGLFGQDLSSFGLGGHQMSDTRIIKILFDRHWQMWHRIILLVFVSITGLLYGGIHAMKWVDPFPTAIERQLWRISSCVGALGIIPVIFLGMPGFSGVWISQERPRRYFDSVCIVCGVVAGLAFVVARTFLVVESFLSIRSLLAGSFQVVKWLDLFGSGRSIGQE